MSIQKIMARFRTRLTVYEHDFKSFGRAGVLSSDEAFVGADQESIRSLFAREPALAARFQKFVNAGYHGVFLTSGGEWVTYSWFSEPHGPQPQHLPRWTRNLDACWIFYCHTKKSFRGRGHFAKLLRYTVETIRNQSLASYVYVDTHVTNLASRRVMLSAGFTPCGLITTYQLWLPRCGNLFIVGNWRRHQPHPPVQTGSAENPGLPLVQPTH